MSPNTSGSKSALLAANERLLALRKLFADKKTANWADFGFSTAENGASQPDLMCDIEDFSVSGLWQTEKKANFGA